MQRAKTKAGVLNARVEAVNRRVEAWEGREEEWQRRTEKRVKVLLCGFVAVVVGVGLLVGLWRKGMGSGSWVERGASTAAAAAGGVERGAATVMPRIGAVTGNGEGGRNETGLDGEYPWRKGGVGVEGDEAASKDGEKGESEGRETSSAGGEDDPRLRLFDEL
ncbi:hypothetical protein MMC24_005294 [Lignoscripta atroalba]|nr:hypothetical protein [Lignoscripta atroalba]